MLPWNWKIQIVYSRRKTLAAAARGDGRILVKAPYGMTKQEISRFLEKVQPKLEQDMAEMDLVRRKTREEGYLTRADMERLAKKAVETIPGRVQFYAEKIGVSYGRITIRNQKSRWGSCSSKGNLNFNCLLMLTPDKAIDSVIVHELCHRKEMNHSPKFYEEVLKVFPEYYTWDRWLKKNGTAILLKGDRKSVV